MSLRGVEFEIEAVQSPFRGYEDVLEHHLVFWRFALRTA
jgi:hypothetical protein